MTLVQSLLSALTLLPLGWLAYKTKWVVGGSMVGVLGDTLPAIHAFRWLAAVGDIIRFLVLAFSGRPVADIHCSVRWTAA